MTADRLRRLRTRALLAVEALLAAVLLPAAGAGAAPAAEVPPAAVAADHTDDGADDGDGSLTVMTRNFFNGTGVGGVFRATTEAELLEAGSRTWADLLASDVPARAAALADEIVAARPDVVGLQEVTLWRDQVPGDVLTRPGADAAHVVVDVLALLREALADRGVPYTAAATSTGADVEFPRRGDDGRPVDLRLTDRDVLLVRADREDRVSDPRSGHYTAQFGEPFLLGPGESTRGWAALDYRVDATTTVRVLDTHLEVVDAATGDTQDRQAAELVALLAAGPTPVVALGDFNAPADGPASPAYARLTALLTDAWRAVRPADPGWTCCQAPSLAAPVGTEAARIDLVLTSADLEVDGVARTGDRPFRAAPPPLWTSDHLGVTARVRVAPH